MGENVTLTAADDHRFGAYRSDPAGRPKGAVVVIQEIFGVNAHIRDVADRFAAEGYVAIAPALFDRAEPGFDASYGPESAAKGRGFVQKIGYPAMLRDVDAAKEAVKSAGPVAIVGFCLGGSVAFNAAADLDGFTAVVGYYGGRIAQDADKAPRCPTMLHFGDQDQSIPMSDVDAIKRKRPDAQIFVYHAGHGFNCDQRSNAFEPESAKLAWTRTLGHLQLNFAKAA